MQNDLLLIVVIFLRSSTIKKKIMLEGFYHPKGIQMMKYYFLRLSSLLEWVCIIYSQLTLLQLVQDLG